MSTVLTNTTEAQKKRKDNAPTLLALKGLSKSFPGIRAVDDVSLEIDNSDIHALLGENGAGKSTLIKMIYGILAPDDGEMYWRGESHQLSSPVEARRLGIGMVFQHFSLFEALTVADNIELSLPPQKQGGPKRREIPDLIANISTKYGLPLDPYKTVHDLSVGEKQRIEIVRCLVQDPQLLIMDEPTSVLTPQEANRLFETLRRLSDDGCAILYISHKLQEIQNLCNSATILRNGRIVNTCDPRHESSKSLAQMMIGTAPEAPKRKKDTPLGEPMLELREFSKPATTSFGVQLKNISLTVHQGEIVGIAGVAGNGQGELTEALIGETALDSRSAMPRSQGAILINGQDITALKPKERRLLGACFIPEERNGHATSPDMSLSENSLLTAANTMTLAQRGWVQEEKRESFTENIIKAFSVKSTGTGATARSLSGGNLQKFIVGREIRQKPLALVVNQPSWGVDAGSAAAIQEALIQRAREGAAILVLSQDIDELFAISDRIGVLFDGELFDPLPVETLTIEQLGLMMGGVR